MTARGLPSRGVRAPFVALLTCVSLSLSACASSYAGIPLAAGTADPELQSLARRAQAGDAKAQLELGIRYEEGRGVPADRSRARRLYFAAASESSGKRISIYLPRKGGGGNVRHFPAARKLSGPPEAILRWHRLAYETGPRPDPRSSGASAAPMPSRATPIPAIPIESKPRISSFDDSWEDAAIEEYAALNFGRHPIFQPLKSGSKDWRSSIVLADPITVLSPFTARQSLALLVEQGPPAQIGREFDEARATALCESHLSRPPADSADLRLLGICLLNRPSTAATAFPAAAAQARRLLLERETGLDLPYLTAASDVVFLYRVANRLGLSGPAADLAALLPGVGRRVAAAARECKSRPCSVDRDYLLRRADFLRAQMMLAMVEKPRAAHLLKAERDWLETFARPIANDPTFQGTVVEAVCSPLGLASDECRRRYSFEPGLDQYVARTVATFVASEHPANARCKLLDSRIDAIEDELTHREDLAEMLDGFLGSRCRLSVGNDQ